ncbi:MAG: hypothetical protein M3R17_17635 [Bacteroidota bacterium]|nr:hypothetical protein [Bacteroidota bacterium]
MNRILFLFLISAFTFSGCRKDEPVIVDADGVRALILVQHHGIPIPNARIFVKNGTIDFPGQDTTLYDTRYVTDANGRLTLTGIPNGQSGYCYYAKGIDPGWDTTQTTPVWGYQYLITDTHIGEKKDYTVSISVSE